MRIAADKWNTVLDTIDNKDIAMITVQDKSKLKPFWGAKQKHHELQDRLVTSQVTVKTEY